MTFFIRNKRVTSQLYFWCQWWANFYDDTDSKKNPSSYARKSRNSKPPVYRNYPNCGVLDRLSNAWQRARKIYDYRVKIANGKKERDTPSFFGCNRIEDHERAIWKRDAVSVKWWITKQNFFDEPATLIMTERALTTSEYSLTLDDDELTLGIEYLYV